MQNKDTQKLRHDFPVFTVDALPRLEANRQALCEAVARTAGPPVWVAAMRDISYFWAKACGNPNAFDNLEGIEIDGPNAAPVTFNHGVVIGGLCYRMPSDWLRDRPGPSCPIKPAYIPMMNSDANGQVTNPSADSYNVMRSLRCVLTDDMYHDFLYEVLRLSHGLKGTSWDNIVRLHPLWVAHHLYGYPQDYFHLDPGIKGKACRNTEPKPVRNKAHPAPCLDGLVVDAPRNSNPERPLEKGLQTPKGRHRIYKGLVSSFRARMVLQGIEQERWFSTVDEYTLWETVRETAKGKNLTEADALRWLYEQPLTSNGSVHPWLVKETSLRHLPAIKATYSKGQQHSQKAAQVHRRAGC